jgi:8-oxo-dGTP pyrophosphatase MutT (NUDIX family)
MELLTDLLERLAQRLHQPLPGSAVQRTMEPELSFGRHCGPARFDARPAAVVALLHMVQGQWYVPLMLRHESLAYHAGQISLPGGVIEPNETSEDAALRELEEELGIARMAVLVLGQLSPLYIFGSNFLITPWVAALRSEGKFRANPTEVQQVIQVSLAHLLSSASRGQHIEQRGSIRFQAPHFILNEHRIWGATAMVLAEFVAVVRDVLQPS